MSSEVEKMKQEIMNESKDRVTNPGTSVGITAVQISQK